MEKEDDVPETEAYTSPSGVEHEAAGHRDYRPGELPGGVYDYGAPLHQIIKAVIDLFPNTRAKNKARSAYRSYKQQRQLMVKWLPEMEKLIREAGKNIDDLDVIEDVIDLMSLINVKGCPTHLAPM